MDRDLINLRNILETFVRFDSPRQVEFMQIVRNLREDMFLEFEQDSRQFSQKDQLDIDAYTELKIVYSRNVEFLDQIREAMFDYLHKTL